MRVILNKLARSMLETTGYSASTKKIEDQEKIRLIKKFFFFCLPFFFFCCHTSPIHLGSFLNANHYHLQLLLSSGDPAILCDPTIARLFTLARVKTQNNLD